MTPTITKWLYAFVFLVVCMTVPHGRALAQTGPSFACAGAKDVTAVICGDAELSADDRRLTALYAVARKDVFGLGASGEIEAQRKWLKDLDADCSAAAFSKHAKTQRACIKDQYEGRLHDLAETDVISAHDLAMPEIRQFAPDDAAVYEAIYLYTTIDDPKRRAARVTAVLTPVYAGLDKDVKSQFSEDGGPVTAQAAAASDQAFGLFVALADSRGGRSVVWPCAAMVRRPGLIAATGSLYGSSLDNGVPGADCVIMTPPVPEFTDLVATAMRSGPDCDGTIRFAGYRNYDRLETEALLHRPDQWAKEDKNGVDANEAAFRRKHAADIARAGTALAAYYGRVFRLDGATAGRDARSAVDIVVNRAFNLCEG